MLFSKTSTQKGIIKMIVLIVAAILILSYFGYNLRAIVSSPNTQDNFSYVGGILVDLWNNILKVPVTYIWDLFINLIWSPAIDNLKTQGNTPPSTAQMQSLIPSPAPAQ